MTRDHFSVHQFLEDGSSACMRFCVDAGTAVHSAKAYTLSVGAETGIIRRIIITDSGDFTCFEWKYGEGVTFPTREDFEGLAKQGATV